MSVNITLREKAISGGLRNSLYLDFYPGIPGQFHPVTGKPLRREFLKKHVFRNPKGPAEKLHNKETYEVAKEILRNRINEIGKPEIYSLLEKDALKNSKLGEASFMEYFKRLAAKRTGTSESGWMAAFRCLDKFTGGKLIFADLNKRLCNDFRDFLLTDKSIRTEKVALSTNSASVYFSKFKAALRQAYKDDLIPTDLSAKIDSIKTEETRRSYLTLEEVNALVQTECENIVLKRAAIFSVFTGLRFSDIQKLVWSEITHTEGEGYLIHFRQKKTKGVETLPIPEEAFNLLGERQGPSDIVFKGLVYSAYYNKHLARWVGLAGISKNVTFHAFRHTYATLQLSLGTDIYTVSKLLGHKDLKTTQIYAKIIDKTKREASNRIQLNINNWK